MEATRPFVAGSPGQPPIAEGAGIPGGSEGHCSLWPGGHCGRVLERNKHISVVARPISRKCLHCAHLLTQVNTHETCRWGRKSPLAVGRGQADPAGPANQPGPCYGPLVFRPCQAQGCLPCLPSRQCRNRSGLRRGPSPVGVGLSATKPNVN